MSDRIYVWEEVLRADGTRRVFTTMDGETLQIQTNYFENGVGLSPDRQYVEFDSKEQMIELFTKFLEALKND